MHASPAEAHSGRSAATALDIVAALLALGALAAYARFLMLRAIDVPLHDDILDVLGFLMRFADADSWAMRWHEFIARYNDHRTSSGRMVYLVMCALRGEIDFRQLVFVVNLAVAAFAALLALASPRGTRIVAAAVAVLLLCNPRGREFLLWPMAMFAFQGVLVYALAALLALRTGGWGGLALAGALATLAMLSLASGQLVWLAGLGLLALEWRSGTAGAARRLAAWGIVSAAAIGLYYWGFESANPMSRLVALAVASPLHHAQYILVVLGSSLAFGSTTAAIGVGAALFALLLGLTPGALREPRPVLLLYAWYLAASVFLVAIGRAPVSVLAYALDPRYGVFSAALLTCLVLMLGARFGLLTTRRATLPLGLAVIYCLACGIVWTPVADEGMNRRVEGFNAGRYWVYGYPLADTNAIVAEAIRRGIYSPPPRPLRLPRDGARK